MQALWRLCGWPLWAALLLVTACGGDPAPVAPAIGTQPANATVSDGQAATFSVVGTGSGPLTYQWRRNGTDIAGATSASYTTPATTLADSGAAYSVVIINSAGTVTSANATLTVTPIATAITAQPQAATVDAGQSATFTVVAVGSAPLAYQWQADGVDIADASAASHTTAAVGSSSSGTVYRVVVSGPGGSVTSAGALLTVRPTPLPPIIVQQPAAQSVVAGQSAQFSVVAQANAPISYQWRRNGTAIAGATAAAYTTPVTVIGDNGALFSVVVSTSAGNVTSSDALLTVGAAPVAPTIAAGPANQTVNAGQTATFSVVANGTAPLAYQWKRNGADIAGATAASHTTGVLAVADSGATFSVAVSNSVGSVTSGAATLTVLPVALQVVQVSAGQNHAMALMSDGSVRGWGGAMPAQGAGANVGVNITPVPALQVGGAPLTGVASVAAGNDTTAVLKTDGTVWTAGSNFEGMLGDGTTQDRNLFGPVTFQGNNVFNGVTRIAIGHAGGYIGLALRNDTTLWAWGQRTGDGTTTTRTQPVQVTLLAGGVLDRVVAMAAGASHSLAVRDDGTVWTWGANFNGKLGDGTFTNRNAAVRVETAAGVPLDGIVAVAAGSLHSVALRNDGTVWAWGYNVSGALGDGTGTNRARPVQMRDAQGNLITDAVAIDAGEQMTLVVRAGGGLYATGVNGFGQLGDGTTTTRLALVAARDAQGNPFGGVAQVAANQRFNLLRRSDGSVWGWGSNNGYKLGDGTQTDRWIPTRSVVITP
jgi:alpha-tubulin suppressor-like RCC1 family protein